jgi:poly-gamma-glutamate capsule biosynthesis protein CapA/YwtB (metallophosphatase superfamily)
MSSEFTLAAVGDVVLTRSWTRDEGTDPRFLEVVDLLGGADLAFANLESPVSRTGYSRDKMVTLRTDPELVDDLKGMHFDVFSVANNHTLDYGEDSLMATLEVLESNGLRAVGAGKDLDDALRPAIVEANGARVAFFACSCLLPLGSSAGVARPGLAPLRVHTSFEVDPYMEMEEPGHAPAVHTRPDEADLARICAGIAAVRDSVDFVAVSVHMGFGVGEEVAGYQQVVAHAFIDAGADVVLGNHAHVIQGIETYRGKAILYSPSNFVAQQPREGQSPEVLELYARMSSDAYLAFLDVAPGGSYRMRIVPTVGNDNGLPVQATGADFDRIADRIARLSALLNTSAQVDGSGITIEFGR